jgi:hypothetical protein
VVEGASRPLPGFEPIEWTEPKLDEDIVLGRERREAVVSGKAANGPAVVTIAGRNAPVDATFEFEFEF